MAVYHWIMGHDGDMIGENDGIYWEYNRDIIGLMFLGT
jgi:hypothetical protein